MKWSIYNVIRREKNQTYIFNTLTRATVVLDCDIYNENIDNIPKVELNDLINMGIIVSEEADEYLLFLYWYNMRVTQKKFFAITYIPTYNCNFECSYCIEGTVNVTGKKLDIKRIFDYLEYRLKSEKYDVIDFVFYGGEPLLALNNIIQMAQFLRKKSIEYSKSLKMAIVTNGYLLNENNIKDLVESGILTYQITIDGKRELHNKRRHLKNGRETYDVIVNNINIMTAKYKNVNVVLNINYDESNSKDILDFLDSPPFDLRKVHIKLNPIKSSCKNVNNIGQIVHRGDASILYSKIRNKGLDDENRVLNEFGPCLKRIRNSIIVDCYGNLYKCVYGVGNEKNIVGTIDSGVGIDTYAKDIVVKENCKKCNILPICMTGCPRHRKEFDNNECKKEEIFNTIVNPIMENIQ